MTEPERLAVKTKSVCLVEDDPSVRNALIRLAKLYGCSASSFESSKELLASARRETDAGILTDVHMAGIGGLGLLKGLAAAGRDMPVILIAGYTR